MARFATPKSSFLVGEVSPKVYGRSDLPEYAHAAKKLQNMLVDLQGSASMRPGTQYVASPQSINPTGGRGALGRLIPFIFSITESYCIFLSDTTTDQGIQVYRNDGTLCTVLTSLTDTSPITISHLELYEWQYVQSADTLYLLHPNHKPIILRRTDSTHFGITHFDDIFGANAAWTTLYYPFLDANIDTTKHLTPSATSGAIGITSDFDLFTSAHVGAIFKITQSATTGVAKITSVTNARSASATVLMNFANTTGSTDWEESAWSDARGWPRTATFFEGRLVYGGNTNRPDTIWASKVGNYNHLMARMLVQDWGTNSSGLGYFGTSTSGPTVKETDPFTFTLASTEVNQIQWFSSSSTLSIGTLGAEYVANGGQDRILSALNPSFVPQTNYGSSYLRPQKVGTSLLFVSRDGQKIREFSYDYRFGSYKAPEITLYADHLISSDLTVNPLNDPAVRIIDMVFQVSRNIVWVLVQGINTGKSLIAFTYDKDKAVTAFHRHLLGGRNQILQASTFTWIPCAPAVTGIAVIPNASGTQDELWVCVQRTSGVTIEKMGADFVAPTLNQDYTSAGGAPFFSDASAVAVGTNQTTFFGFNWVKGETVSVVADGKIHRNVVVDNTGAVTLDFAASQIVVGLPYQARVELLPIDQGAVLGSALGSIQRVDQVAIRFRATVGAKMGVSDASLETITFVPAGQPMSQALPLFTGVKRLPFPGGYTEDSTFVLIQDLPLPMNVSSITLRGNTNET